MKVRSFFFNPMEPCKAIRRDCVRKILVAICVLAAAPHAFAQTWTEQGDAGQLCSTAQVPTGTGTLSQISGSASSVQDVDAFRIRIDDPAAFSASTIGGSEFPIRVLFLFSASTCNGITMSNFASVDQAATITGQLVAAAGDYVLVIASWEKLPQNAASAAIWNPGSFSEVQPNGSGAPGPLSSWSTTSFNQPTGAYTITLTGASYNPPAPANDLCAAAKVLTSYGTTPFSNQAASTDGPAACGSLRNDVWFKHTACVDGAFTADTCTGTSFDTVLAVYSGTCGGLTLVKCNDDTNGCGPAGTHSRVTWTATVGTTYWIRVGGLSGARGDGTLTMSGPECCSPPVIDQQPVGISQARVGSHHSLTAHVTGSPPISVQWFRLGDPNPIPGAYSTTLDFPELLSTDNNSYSMVASNSCGEARSNSSAVFASTNGDLLPIIPGCSTLPAWDRDDDGDGRSDWSGDANKNGIADSLDDNSPQNGEVLLCLRGIFQELVEARLTAMGLGGLIAHVFCIVPVLHLRNVNQAKLQQIASDSVLNNGLIAFIQSNVTYHKRSAVSVPSLGVTSGFYSPNTVRQRDTWVDGSGINVAILDTGVDNPGSRVDVNTPSNPSLLNIALPKATHGYDVVRDMALPRLVPPSNALRAEASYDPDDNDPEGHGTHVASIILGRGVQGVVPRGVANAANLIDIKVLDQNGMTNSATILRAIEVVWSHQAFLGPVHIVYFGFTADVPEDELSAVSQLLDIVAGEGAAPAAAPLTHTILVAPAGDDQDPDTESRLKRLPASHRAVIAVGATDDRNTQNRADDTLWQFTPAGPRPLIPLDAGQYTRDHIRPQLVAPGVDIVAAASNSVSGTRSLTGTSMAAAHVAGVVALLIQGGTTDPLSAMIQTAELPAGVPSFSGPFVAGQEPERPWNEKWGYGKLNAFGALDSFIDRSTDVSFVDENGNPAFGPGRNDAFTLLSGVACDSDVALRVRVKNFGPHYAAKGVQVGFGAAPNSATNTFAIDSTAHFIRDSVWQRLLSGALAVGETKTFDVVAHVPSYRTVHHCYLPGHHWCNHWRRGDLAVKAFLAATNDGTSHNNFVSYDDSFTCSPVSYEVANHFFQGPATFTFDVATLTPGSKWTIQLDAESITLSPEDPPEVLTALPIPPHGTPDGAQETFTLTTFWESEIVGEVTIHATMHDCNGNGCDDWFDIVGGPECPIVSADVDENGIPDSCEIVPALFRRGDVNNAGSLDISSAINILGFLFSGGVTIACMDAADANDDGRIDLSDAISILGFLFLGGPPTPAPGPFNCGPDTTTTDDALDCASYPGCN